MTSDPRDVVSLHKLLDGAPTNWGRWGDDDEIGALNFLGPAEVLAAAASIRQGKVFTLQTQMCNPKGDPTSPKTAPKTASGTSSTWRRRSRSRTARVRP